MPNQHATWHSLMLPRVPCMNLPRHATCQAPIGPRHRTVATSSCHVSSSCAATCHHPALPRHCTESTSALYGLPCVTVRTCHVSLYGRATSAVRTGTVSIPKFACLAFRTERDIFLIRTPFAIKIIPPDSGRRDGRNGTGFV
jgi:hypothetical protein